MYSTVLDTHKEKMCILHRAAHVCYRQQIKLDCVPRT